VTGSKHGFELSPLPSGTSTRAEKMAALEWEAARARPWPSSVFVLHRHWQVRRRTAPLTFLTLEDAMLHAGQVGEWRYRPRIGQSGPWYESSDGHWTIEP
jgi:hypothetical protein